MITTYLRSSSWGTHDFCPMKFFLSFVLGWQETPNPKTQCGTVVHKVLEVLAKIKRAEQNGDKSYTDDICGKINLKK